MSRSHVAVVGLGYGDEGKGATVDWLCARGDVDAVVRFNGGGQAAHNVVVDGVHHTFRQFGSGSLSGVPTVLASPVLVDLVQLAAESLELHELGIPAARGLFGTVTAHPACRVVTPWAAAANHAREAARGQARHGSCGLGIGETVAYDLAHAASARAGDVIGDAVCPGDADEPPLRVADCRDRPVLTRRLDALARYYEPLTGPDVIDDVAWLRSALADVADSIVVDDPLTRLLREGRVVFEGAQGLLLDEQLGFHPHTTWSRVVPEAPRVWAAAAGAQLRVLGVTRTYHTRHGDGPFPSERNIAAPEAHNGTGEHQGDFRVGALDLPLLRYAIGAVRPDALVVTHADVDAPVVTYDAVPVPADPTPAGQQALGERLSAVHPRDVDVRALDALGGFGLPCAVVAGGPDRADRRTDAGVAADRCRR